MRRASFLALALACACSSESPPKATAEICGNGKDDDGNGSVDCADSACAASCPTCGDGKRDAGEGCDGADLGADTCATRGYTGGTLACTSTCTLDETACTREEDCSTAGDEDQNGAADCADAACKGEPACRVMDVVSAPPETGVITSTFGLTVRVLDGSGQPVGGAVVRAGAPPGADIQPAEITTGDTGLASFHGRRSPVAGPQVFDFTPDAGAGVQVVTTAVEPPPLTVVTVLGADHTQGTDSGGSALIARVGAPMDLAVSEDRTLFVAEACRLLRVTPEGELSLLGGGEGGCSGDPGDTLEPADPISISGLALDGDGGLLLSDPRAKVVRRLELATGALTVVAGGGKLAPEDAEGGLATAAELGHPGELSWNPALGILAMDSGSGRLLSIAGGKIHTLLQTSTSCDTKVALQTCAGGCRALVDDAGTVFVAGGLCGSDPKPAGGSSAVSGMVRLDSVDLVHVAGLQNGALQAVPSWQAGFFGRLRPAFDRAGNLFAFSSSRLARIDAYSQATTLLIADNAPGFAGDAEPLTAARFSTPGAMVIDSAGDAWVADTNNFAVRRIVGLGLSQPDPLEIAPLHSGEEVRVAERLPSDAPGALRVRVTGREDAPLEGERVRAVPLTGGTFVYPPGATDATGSVALDVRAGLAAGQQDISVDLPGLHGRGTGSAVTVALIATNPQRGLLFTAVGADGTKPGAFPDGPTAGPPAPIAASDIADGGSHGLFVAAACRLYLLKPDGELDVVAGTGACFDGGDGGPAKDAPITAAHLAYDRARDRLYVSAGFVPDLIRSIDLKSGVITRFAGGNGGVDPGDGGPALDAVLGGIRDMDVAADGTLGLIDANLLRSVNPATGIIQRHLVADAPFPCAVEDMGKLESFVGLVADGDHFVVGVETCAPDFPLPQSILDVARDGSWVNMGGRRGGSDEDGVALPDVDVLVTGFTHDLEGNLVYADSGRIRRIDRQTSIVTTLAGDWHGVLGDYIPGTSALFEGAREPVFDATGRLWFIDGSVRVIW